VYSPEEFLSVPKDENVLLEFLISNANSFKDKAPKMRICKEYLSKEFVCFKAFEFLLIIVKENISW
jgi:hypothetical protein